MSNENYMVINPQYFFYIRDKLVVVISSVASQTNVFNNLLRALVTPKTGVDSGWAFTSASVLGILDACHLRAVATPMDA